MIFKINGPPGTGKTTYIVNLVASLIEKGNANPSNIYALSFSKAAKGSLLKKFQQNDIYVPENNIRTLHSFAYKELNIDPWDLDSGNSFVEIFFRD